MGLVFGPSKSHSSYVNWPATALGDTVCGGRLYCKSGTGIAWIVAPAATQVSAAWTSNWPSLNTALTNGGLNPSQWFVPSLSQLQSGYACRTYWDSFSSSYYWSSTERSGSVACDVNFNNGAVDICTKSYTLCVRAFRCVTY